MSLFQPSTKAVSAACQEIADTVGASGDGEMTARAGRSLFAAFKHFNNKAYWDYLRTEAPPVIVVAPFTIGSATASGGAASAACPAGHGILPDDFVAGYGFPVGTRVSATAASGFGFYGASVGFTGTATATLTITRDMYDLPSDCRAIYSVRTLQNNQPLTYIGRRLYDRQISSEQTTSTPFWYDLFMVGARGKIRLLQPPTSADVLQMRYYRRMTVPTTSATAAALDIVDDFEPYLIAWGKWHFLVDKGEGRGEQAKTWFSLAQEGLKMMLESQTKVPDEGLVFVPGHASFGTWSDTTTRWIDWETT